MLTLKTLELGLNLKDQLFCMNFIVLYLHVSLFIFQKIKDLDKRCFVLFFACDCLIVPIEKVVLLLPACLSEKYVAHSCVGLFLELFYCFTYLWLFLYQYQTSMIIVTILTTLKLDFFPLYYCHDRFSYPSSCANTKFLLIF